MKLSLAQWSLHHEIFNGLSTSLDFPSLSVNEFGIYALEYVNRFFRKEPLSFFHELRHRADDVGAQSLILMCDGEGRLGDPDQLSRNKAVENHFRWVEAAKILDCHAIRVNPDSEGSYEEQLALVTDGLYQLTEFAESHGISVIIENHGGFSSNGKWVADVIKAVNHPFCGTLPDFGNFRITPTEQYDRYLGIEQMMPYAKGVSAKSWDFDADGNETEIDYERMLTIVANAGYKGYIGIEYEGLRLPEREGILATKRLLERYSYLFSV